MESNRQGIAKEPAPSVVMRKKTFSGEVSEKGSADCVLEIVGSKLEMDSNGNEIKKLFIEVKSIKKVDNKKGRVW